MIRMIECNAAQAAKTYFNDSLATADYYLNKQEIAGVMQGKIAARLNIPGVASKRVFHALCDNINPLTGKPLTLRTKEYRRIGYDINFHVPKSISIIHALSHDDHILVAFHETVEAIMQDIEADAKTRVRKQGMDEDRATGELLWASFIHQTARAVQGSLPDVHLHCHCFTFNVTYDPVEQQFKAAQFGDIKRDMPYYQAKFHKQLSDRLMGLGYGIRRTDNAFEVVGVPQQAIDLFSKRTNEIGQIAKAEGITDIDALGELGARTRKKKEGGLSMAELKNNWRRQIYEAGMNADVSVRHRDNSVRSPLSPEQCINHAMNDRFQRVSVIRDRRLLETAFRFAIGDLTTSPKSILNAFDRNREIIRVKEKDGIFCTTLALLAEEQHMIGLAQSGIGSVSPMYRVPPSLSVADQQAGAVLHVLTTRDRVAIILGRAGTGKTTLMREAVRYIIAAGVNVLTVAPTSEAARDVLRSEGFANAETVAKLLVDEQLQNSLVNSVLWVDEAGLLGNKDMIALLELVKAKNARLILSGDTRQHSAVARGDALRLLHTEGKIATVSVSRIYRQQREDYKAAVQALSDGDVQNAFLALQGMGAIKKIDPAAPYAGLVEDYYIAVKKKKTALVISPTHQEGERVTAAIRERLKEAKKIKQQDVAVSRLVSCNLTAAQKQDWRNYKPGQVLQFSQNLNGIPRGSAWEVQKVMDDAVIIADKKSRQALLPLNDADSFEVYRKTEISLAKGDSVRITRNGFDTDKRRLNNGQLLEVVSVDPQGIMKLRNSKSKTVYKVNADYGHITHGYCLTSNVSQGKTTDVVFIMQPEATFPASDLKQFYVSVSRGKEAAMIYTDNVDRLQQQVKTAQFRIAAIELKI